MKRDRVLADEEVVKILKGLPDAAISADTRDILRLLFLTGQRSGEVCGMRRSEVDVARAMWTIPAGRTKNALAHVVPLSGDALDIVEPIIAALKDEEGDPPLFSKIGDPIESNAIAQAVRKKLQITGERWTPHDIRRTVATSMAGLGIQPHIIESVLNHISGFRAGVAGIYNRNTYEPEKRRALDLWASHLTGLQTGEQKIVVLRKEGAA